MATSKTVLITGCSSGIGRATAERLVRAAGAWSGVTWAGWRVESPGA
ncbi:MAG: hypothetical protein ONB46_16480 [candidate division KSB1 bacterium]|nr:hypothetical protein [candidate division KSB1 bacterium]MDZ7367247.1 hypothetical protein [candidate division KSB1 bacterium]